MRMAGVSPTVSMTLSNIRPRPAVVKTDGRMDMGASRDRAPESDHLKNSPPSQRRRQARRAYRNRRRSPARRDDGREARADRLRPAGASGKGGWEMEPRGRAHEQGRDRQIARLPAQVVRRAGA